MNFRKNTIALRLLVTSTLVGSSYAFAGCIEDFMETFDKNHQILAPYNDAIEKGIDPKESADSAAKKTADAMALTAGSLVKQIAETGKLSFPAPYTSTVFTVKPAFCSTTGFSVKTSSGDFQVACNPTTDFTESGKCKDFKKSADIAAGGGLSSALGGAYAAAIYHAFTQSVLTGELKTHITVDSAMLRPTVQKFGELGCRFKEIKARKLTDKTSSAGADHGSTKTFVGSANNSDEVLRNCLSPDKAGKDSGAMTGDCSSAVYLKSVYQSLKAVYGELAMAHAIAKGVRDFEAFKNDIQNDTLPQLIPNLKDKFTTPCKGQESSNSNFYKCTDDELRKWMVAQIGEKQKTAFGLGETCQ